MNLYIDPGTGSMLFTILIGVLGALAYVLRNVFVKARFFLSGGKRIKEEHEYPYVIFTDSKRYWNIFKPICDEMEKRGQKVLYLTASEDDPALECSYKHIRTEFAGHGNQAFARMNMIRADIVLSSTPSLDVYQWKRSRDVKWYVHIPHGIYDLSLYRMYGLDFYDAVLMTGPFQTDAIRKLETIRNWTRKELKVVGMPYMDTMLARVRNEKKAEDGIPTVLLAPTWGPSSLLNRYGGEMIDALLKTEYRIIIRPHPQSFESEKEMIERLMNQYPDNDRMEWDRKTDNYDSLRKASVLISDFSGVIFDFAFVFEKPVIYADTSFDPGPYDASWLENEPVWIFSTLERIGLQLKPENVGRIGDLIEEAIHSERLRAGREEAKAESWSYIGHSAEHVADYLMEARERITREGENRG